MRIKGFFYILVFLLLALGSVLLFLSSQLNTIFFYIGEGLILFILIYMTFFYRKIVKPLNTIGSGMELLREQDFSSRLSPVGQYEADRVVNIFNRMMEQLKNERLRLREQNNFLDLLIKASPMSERTCSSWVFVMTSTGVVVVAGLHSDVRSGAGVLAMAFFSLFSACLII